MSQKRYAILIASSTFPSESSLEDLRCPPNDVDGLHEVLTSKPGGLFDSDDITVLKNLTSSKVSRGISKVLQKATKNDLVFIYYSGHGRLDPNGKLYLCTHNTEVALLVATSVPIDLLTTMLEVSKCALVAVVLDCCFSGAATGDAIAKGGDIQRQLDFVSSGRGTYVMTACSPNQLAHEKKDDKYAVFTKHFIAGLRSAEADKDSDGFITMDDLYKYVCKHIKKDSAQKPKKSAKLTGEFIIASTGKSPRKERKKSLRKMLSDMLGNEEAPDKILIRAIEIVAKDAPELTDIERRLDHLLDKMVDGKIKVGNFVAEWSRIDKPDEQIVIDKNKTVRESTAPQQQPLRESKRGPIFEPWLWLLANIGGGILGFLVAMPLKDKMKLSSSHFFNEIIPVIVFIVTIVVSVGITQSLLLRQVLSRPNSWIKASILGWAFAIGYIVFFYVAFLERAGTDGTLFIMMAFLSSFGGILSGAYQMRLLRATYSRAIWWPVANGLAWPVCAGVTLVAALAAKGEEHSSYEVAKLGGVVGWLFVSAITMDWILKATPQHETRE